MTPRELGPEFRPTAELPKSDILEGLLRSIQGEMREGFANVNLEIERLDKRMADVEQRTSHGSGRARAQAESAVEVAKTLANETQNRKALEAELLLTRERLDTFAAEVTATKDLAVETKLLTEAQTEELTKQTALLNRLAAFAANPVVKDFARMVATAIATALAVKGLK